ncbi:hypothetical protein F2P81_001298 [Scophthalmus maximus]|uniref:Gastrin/cholecystokinin peptide hormone domain-containing protein n=1 Tax=Scophthalmus maximus TaxID=52904 RepID=A0A6A4TQX9_SCOMX|nr:hypothetical protein F2P81_001298 [Scophthalmus maximus]
MGEALRAKCVKVELWHRTLMPLDRTKRGRLDETVNLCDEMSRDPRVCRNEKTRHRVSDQTRWQTGGASSEFPYLPTECVRLCVRRVALLEAGTHTLGEPHLRQSRSAPQLKALPVAEEDGDSRANLSELLARLISSRKGSVRRNSSANSRGSANHRIADRDYLGWMDFGRRSAEEYEYSS